MHFDHLGMPLPEATSDRCLIDDQVHFVENKQFDDHIKFLALMVSDKVELDEEIKGASTKKVVGFPEEEEVFTSKMIARRPIIPNTMASLGTSKTSQLVETETFALTTEVESVA